MDQKIYAHLQNVNIETDEDILGFKDFHIKNEKYFKYNESFIHTNPEKMIYMILQKNHYVQLYSIGRKSFNTKENLS